MKKNGWILLVFVILGLLAGALVARWLKDVPGLTFLTRTMSVSWEPKADLAVIQYDLTLEIHVTLLSILGAFGAIWLYRKM